MFHEFATFPWYHTGGMVGVAQWHYSAHPGKMFDPKTLKRTLIDSSRPFCSRMAMRSNATSRRVFNRIRCGRSSRARSTRGTSPLNRHGRILKRTGDLGNTSWFEQKATRQRRENSSGFFAATCGGSICKVWRFRISDHWRFWPSLTSTTTGSLSTGPLKVRISAVRTPHSHRGFTLDRTARRPRGDRHSRRSAAAWIGPRELRAKSAASSTKCLNTP